MGQGLSDLYLVPGRDRKPWRWRRNFGVCHRRISCGIRAFAFPHRIANWAGGRVVGCGIDSISIECEPRLDYRGWRYRTWIFTVDFPKAHTIAWKLALASDWLGARDTRYVGLGAWRTSRLALGIIHDGTEQDASGSAG